ncbi:hypothetical protein FZEAL_1136 [Fusarium zealandicum]|uniref:Rhodopsin domain-containing protein n=1 Tax=Fusarium zealandicum TaxID=1053134 RepID=A0A8H4XQ66_9HYPO|nr:hypothetical protein FZEAL_1136 [Fusarium zealandicum]
MEPPPLPSNPNENAGPEIIAATSVVVALATIAVVARLYVRLSMIRNIGWDDGFMVAAMVLSWAGQILIYVQVAYGVGKHAGDIDWETYMVGKKLNFLSQPIFLIAICVVKLSVGCALMRIASTKFYRRLILGIMIFMAVYTISCLFCKDLRVLWRDDVTRQCWTLPTITALLYTNSALNITTDFLFAIVIPLPMLWNLNVHLRTRLSLLGILSLGVFVSAAAIIKVCYLANYGKYGDVLWDSRYIIIWAVVELNVGIVGGTLPSLRPLFKQYLGSYYGKNSRHTPNTGPNSYGRGTLRSGSNWNRLGSDRRGDDTGDEASSQRAINASIAEYELRDRATAPSDNIHKTTILTECDAKVSDESANRFAYGNPRGITKTTTTTIESSKH